MKIKTIKIDMDYCSDPIWGMFKGTDHFTNLCIDDFKQTLRPSTLSVLEWYRYTWEWYNWGNISDSSVFSTYEEWHLTNAVSDLQVYAANMVKKDLPHYTVVYCIYEENVGYKYIEVLK